MSKIDITYLNKLQDQYEAKLSEFERNYQDTGSARTQNTIYKYRDMIDVIRLARERLDQYCHSCERHRRSVKELIERYETYKKYHMVDFESFDKFIDDLKDILL